MWIIKQENRECVTSKPYVSSDGEILMCHIIFPATCISSHMAPKTAYIKTACLMTVEKINNLLVSTTDSGYQDGRTCLASYKMFAKAVKKIKCRNLLLFLQIVIHPYMMQMWCSFVEKKTYINSWVSLTQLSWCNSLIKSLQPTRLLFKWKRPSFWWRESKSRGIYIQILASIWDVWTTKESLIKAARRVGITSSGININDMQKEICQRRGCDTTYANKEFWQCESWVTP